MSDSTSDLDLLSSTQGNKEASANALLDAASPAMAFGRRARTTVALDWGYYGGKIYIDGVRTTIAAGVLALSNNTTNYIQVSRAGVVNRVTGTWDADKLPLYKVVTASGVVTSYEDHRDLRQMERFFRAAATQSMTAGGEGNKTLTAEQSLCQTIELTGTLTALRDVIVPAVRRQWTIYANVSGGFGVRVKTSGGSGITVADGKRAILECDGTNVVRVTADV